MRLRGSALPPQTAPLAPLSPLPARPPSPSYYSPLVLLLFCRRPKTSPLPFFPLLHSHPLVQTPSSVLDSHVSLPLLYTCLRFRIPTLPLFLLAFPSTPFRILLFLSFILPYYSHSLPYIYPLLFFRLLYIHSLSFTPSLALELIIFLSFRPPSLIFYPLTSVGFFRLLFLLFMIPFPFSLLPSPFAVSSCLRL